MKVYLEHCTHNTVDNNKTQYKQANFTTVLQSTMFQRGKFKVNDFCVSLQQDTYLNMTGCYTYSPVQVGYAKFPFYPVIHLWMHDNYCYDGIMNHQIV